MEINDLPEELVLEVQRRLPPSSMKMATLVNKLWRGVGDHPTLWEAFTVTVYNKEDIKNLSMKRLRRIEEISINPNNWDVEDWKAFFNAVMGLSKLKKIDRFFLAPRLGDGLRLFEASLLARSLAKLEDVDVDGEGLTDEQIEELFKEMKSTRMKKLGLVSCRLSQVLPALFGKVLGRLEDLFLSANHATQEQMEAFFTEMVNNNHLKRLLLHEDVRHLEPGLFARALSKVEDVSLTRPVADYQLKALFTRLSFGNYQLKKLELEGGGDFSLIEAPLVGHVLSRLEEFKLSYPSTISDDQVHALFTEMASLAQMKKLALDDTDMTEVEEELFGKVIARLEEVELSGYDSCITADQMVAVFNEMVASNSRMKDLYISDADLSSVNPEILAKAVTRLEAVKLQDTAITIDQLTSLFSEISRNMGILKRMDLHGIDLSSVDPQDFARALVRMENVILTECNINQDQAMAFFSEISQNAQLKKLQLQDNLSTVDAQILASAITKMKEVDLSFCTLSQEQISSIFACVLESEGNLKRLNLTRIDAVQVDQEIVRKVKDKLKGQLEI